VTSRVLTPGGFVPLHVMGDGEVTPCTLCGRWPIVGWWHARSDSIVCARCLPDPYDHDGEAGRRAASRIVDGLGADGAVRVI
jgi:hypothetical protein